MSVTSAVSSAKVNIVVFDHKRAEQNSGRIIGLLITEYPFSAYVLENPTISGRGDTEEEAVEQVRRALLTWNTRAPGQTRKIVEVDIGAEMVVRDVIES